MLSHEVSSQESENGFAYWFSFRDPGEPGTEAWVGALGTHIQMGGESVGTLQGGGDQGADLRAHPLPKGEVDGSRWA